MKSNINYLVGNSNFSGEAFEPFSKKVCNFLSDFSNNLNQDKDIKKYPDLKALSFWCRKKNIEKLKKEFTNDNDLRIGLGLAFHITPSNIPTNFAYSLFFGLLSGNSNIVKVPSNDFVQINKICLAIKKALKKNLFFKNKINIVKYKKHEGVSEFFSSNADCRLIWGGDKTIKEVKKFKTKERTVDLMFADRYSFCIIDLKKMSNLNEFHFTRLIEKFYNDTYLNDQNACSSPHLIWWYGKATNVIDRFWKKLFEIVKKKYNLDQSAAFEKYSNFCKFATYSNVKSTKVYENLIYTITLNKIDSQNHFLRGKWGIFFQYNSNNLKDLKKIVNPKYQTLTYFGIDKNLIMSEVLKQKLNGIDRLVPVGQSLDMSLNWDGYNLVNSLSRVIDIK